MDDTDRTTTTPPTGSVRRTSGKGMLWALLAVVIAFFVGFFWQWYEASTVRDQLTAAESELEVQRLRVRLGQATLAAQAGDYESARRQMSSFFTELQGSRDELPQQVGALAGDFLAMRDEVITGLSRSNPEYAGVLYGLLEQLGTAVDQAGMGTGTGMPAGPTPEEAPAPGVEPGTTSADTTSARGEVPTADTMP